MTTLTHYVGVSENPLPEQRSPLIVEVLRPALDGASATNATSDLDLSIFSPSHLAFSQVELAYGVCLKGKNSHSTGNTSTCAWKRTRPYLPERQMSLSAELRDESRTFPHRNAGTWLQQDVSRFPVR